jgi:hypothetical protein
MDLGVGLTSPLMETPPDNLPAGANHDTTHPGVRRSGEPAALAERHRLRHGRLVASHRAPSVDRVNGTGVLPPDHEAQLPEPLGATGCAEHAFTAVDTP